MTEGTPPLAVLRNEFAVVELSCLRRGESTSLVVTDAASGQSIVLDATELEALTRAPREAFRTLLLEAEARDSSAG